MPMKAQWASWPCIARTGESSPSSFMARTTWAFWKPILQRRCSTFLEPQYLRCVSSAYCCLHSSLPSWLAVSSGQYSSLRRQLLRFIALGAWGLVVGLGFWSDYIMLALALISLLLLLVFCWRDLLKGGILFLSSRCSGSSSSGAVL